MNNEKTLGVMIFTYNDIYAKADFVSWIIQYSTKKQKNYTFLLRYWGWALKIAYEHVDKVLSSRRLFNEAFNLIQDETKQMIHDVTLNDKLSSALKGLIPCHWNKLSPSDKKIILRYIQMAYKGVEPSWLNDNHARYTKTLINKNTVSKSSTERCETKVIYKRKRRVDNYA